MSSPETVPARLTVDHINALCDLGWNTSELGDFAGISRATCKTMLNRYEKNPHTRVYVSIAEAILSIPIIERSKFEDLFEQRIKLLHEVGFTQDEIVAISGICKQTIFYYTGRRSLATMKKLDETWPIFEKRLTARAELIKRFGKLAQQNRATKDGSDS